MATAHADSSEDLRGVEVADREAEWRQRGLDLAERRRRLNEARDLLLADESVLLAEQGLNEHTSSHSESRDGTPLHSVAHSVAHSSRNSSPDRRRHDDRMRCEIVQKKPSIVKFYGRLGKRCQDLEVWIESVENHLANLS